MNKTKIVAIVLTVCMCLSCVWLLVACQEPTLKDNYVVTYKINDGSQDDRALTVETGYAASDWTPVRSGYEFLGWYTDADCNKAYDFTMGVYSDTTLYAKWTLATEVCKVSIDPNYMGARKYKDIIVNKGDKLSSDQMPQIDKLGMIMDGWFTDADCTKAYNFDDQVTSNITLYAKYSFDPAIERYTEDDPEKNVKAGDIVFEDVLVEIYYKQSNFDLFRGVGREIETLVEEFNNRPGNNYIGEDGKEHYQIKVSLTKTTITDQSRFQLRVQQIPETNNNNKNYLMVNEALDLANIDTSYYAKEDWYAMNDSYLYGGLGSIPLGCKVPFLVYNAAEMAKYNNGKLPTNYTELSAILAAANTANASKSNYKSITLNRSWPYRECTSTVAFIQNGIPYYQYDSVNNLCYTDWATDAGRAKGLTAATNLYNLFGANGTAGGGFYATNDEKNDSRIITSVLNGQSLMGVISWYDDYNVSQNTVMDTVIKNVANGKLGVLPLSNMFTDNDDEWSSKIPVNTIGFQIYNHNSQKNDAYYAACAIFSDYVVRCADRFAKYGVVPLNKELADKSIFKVPESEQSDVIKLLNMIIPDPDDLYTMDGYILGKPLVTEIAGTGSVQGYLDNIYNLASVDDVRKYADIIANKLTATFVQGGY
ncbi:MAG: InlB B-repeat-containing protein [Clostridia bacterium]|nr:InlB B-repeat-containing protein [Clostridia bacterium]